MAVAPSLARMTSVLPGTASSARRFGKTICVGVTCGLAGGAVGAAFAFALAAVTAWRWGHPAIVWALPFAGAAVGVVLDRFDPQARIGTAAVVRAARDGQFRLGKTMGPLVFVTTATAHAFGASVGREGAVVQIGASAGEALANGARVAPATRRSCITAGMAGGFGAVFGTPATAALFALECGQRGHLPTDALLAAIVAAVAGREVATCLGVPHAQFLSLPNAVPAAASWGRWLLLAVALAAAASLFVHALEACKRTTAAIWPRRSHRLAAGGLVVVALRALAGTDAYLGLGDETIARALTDPGLPWHASLLKGAFTVASLGCGFLGGEVTPLFFMGACLGNALAAPLGLPLSSAAAIGLCGLFAAASKMPLSMAVMAAELFGPEVFLPALGVNAAACALRGRGASLYGRRGEPFEAADSRSACGPMVRSPPGQSA